MWGSFHGHASVILSKMDLTVMNAVFLHFSHFIASILTGLFNQLLGIIEYVISGLYSTGNTVTDYIYSMYIHMS